MVHVFPLLPGVQSGGAGMTKFRVLDLFCGAGGSARGLQLAGFHVTGVDNRLQPRYAGDAFILADAMEVPLEGYDFIWASPPCQAYSIMRNLPWLRGKDYPKLIRPTRDRLRASGALYCIENVMGAKHDGMDADWLCGTMFGLPFYRHRLMETNWFWLRPPHARHNVSRETVRAGRTLGSRARDVVFTPRGKELTRKLYPDNGARRMGAGVGHAPGVALVREAMQIDWMTRGELTEAIPPVYSRFIGEQVRQYLEARP